MCLKKTVAIQIEVYDEIRRKIDLGRAYYY
jgi:hypothetical protein